MRLDAEGDEAVSLRIDCPGGSLCPCALCMGQVGGAAVGVLSVCHHRAAMPSTRFSLREPTTHFETRAREVEQWAQLRSEERQRFTDRVAAAVGRPAAALADAFAGSVFMSAPEASDFGLIDEICRPRVKSARCPDRRSGFDPATDLVPTMRYGRPGASHSARGSG